MLSEEFISTVCGGPLSSNTSIAKDVGVHVQTLSPAYGVRATFKKSSTPANCLAVTPSHVFAAQHEKAYVHVYSRLRGNQEAFVPFPERIRCVALAGDVLVLGTVEGRVMLWEYCTGRLVSTPPCHVQAVSCVATTPFHLLTGSDDSNVHVWSLARILALDATASGQELEPDLTLSNHRAGVTALVVPASSSSTSSSSSPNDGSYGGGGLPDSSICVSASKDKTCVIWNYQTGQPLRTLLFPSFPLCVALDPCARALCVSTADDGCVYLLELFGERALLGPHAAEASSTVVQVSSPFGVSPPADGTDGAGPATCLAVSYDGTVLLSGHPRGKILRWDLADNSLPVELASLNAAVTNIVFVSPFEGAGSTQARIKAPNVVKPVPASAPGRKNYALMAQFDADFGTNSNTSSGSSRFEKLLNTPGFSQETLEEAILAFQQPGSVAGGAAAATTASELELQRQNDELLEAINEQRRLYKLALKGHSEMEAVSSPQG